MAGTAIIAADDIDIPKRARDRRSPITPYPSLRYAMSYIGKLIGGVVGLMLFRHPFAMLLGVAIGHAFDAGWLRIAAHRPAPVQITFIDPLFSIAGALCKADGRVSESEIAATEQLIVRMQLNTDQRRVAIERFTAGKQTGFPTHLSIAALKSWSSGRRDLAYLLLDLLLDIAFAEHEMPPTKLGLLRKLTWALGVSDRELSAIAAMKGYAYAGPGADPGGAAGGARRAPQVGRDPYSILGLTAQATDREVKTAYRRLISQHHPDKLGDVPDELKRRAEERAREINLAYERIQSERKLK